MKPDLNPSPAAADTLKLRRHVRVLVDLGRLAGETSDLEHFLDRAVVQVARAVEIDHVKVLRYRRKTSDLIVAAGIGWKEGVVRSTTEPATLRSPAGQTFQTAEPIVIPDCSNAPGVVVPNFLKQHGIITLANVPVLIDGSAWGVLEVGSTRPRDFSQDTLDFLTAASSLIGAFVRHQGAEASEASQLATAAVQVHNQEVLLSELQHRVKNNFQLILASVALQRRRFRNEEVERALGHVENRINAIALAHDQLAPRDSSQVVSLAAYLRALCRSIEQQVEGVAVEIEADEIELTIDRAVPLGLVLNEAAANSVKHAFGSKGGRITVTPTSGIDYGEACLSIADNGQGVQNPRPGGSGQDLMDSLARQVGGSIDQESSDKGTVTTLTFPVIS